MSSLNFSFLESEEVLRTQVPSRLSEKDRLIQTVLDRLEAKGCKLDRYFDRLCLDEAISNAILHGNGQDPKKNVYVRAFRSEERWAVEVKDEGSGFDWKEALKKATEDPDAARPSGRGVALMVASGAEVLFLDGGNRVLISRRHPT